MDRTERASKIGFASLAALLLVVMLALGGLAATTASRSGGLPALSAAPPTTAQQVPTNAAPAVNSAPITPTYTPTTGAQQLTSAQQAPQSGIIDARPVVRQVGPAVVTVVNTLQARYGGRGRFGGGQGGQALGSGVIIDSQGHIVTNQHVVANQQSLSVIFADGTQAPATLVGEDANADIAVIKVDARVPAVAQFGDSDKLEVGQPVIAIGTALGDFKNTVTEGIVSGVHRTLSDGSTSTQDLIQTDAAINHGNSGGPLLDLNGNIIGINTAVVRSDTMAGDVAEGLGFAIPSNTVKAIANRLIKNG